MCGTTAINKLCNFIRTLRIKVKLLSDDEFDNMIKDFDDQEKAMAILLRNF